MRRQMRLLSQLSTLPQKHTLRSDGMLTRSQKLYLYAIYKLGQDGGTVRSADVAKLVGVSKPSTVKAVQRLTEQGYIVKEPYREIALTEKGVKEANELYTPGVILYDFFRNTVGVSEENADADSVAAVSQLSSEALEKFVQYLLRTKSVTNQEV